MLPALAGHGLAGDRTVHPDVPGRARGATPPRSSTDLGRGLRMPAVLLVPGTVAASSSGPPAVQRGLPRQHATRRREAIAQRDGRDDGRAGAVRLALPRAAGLLRLRGRQDAVLPAGRRHRGGHGGQPRSPSLVDPPTHRRRRRARPDPEQPRRRAGRLRPAAAPARPAAAAVDVRGSTSGWPSPPSWPPAPDLAAASLASTGAYRLDRRRAWSSAFVELVVGVACLPRRRPRPRPRDAGRGGRAAARPRAPPAPRAVVPS